MKRLLYYFIITVACTASSFTSCKMMEDDIFDTDPAISIFFETNFRYYHNSIWE